MTLLLALTLLGWCLILTAAVEAIIVLPMALYGIRPPARSLVLGLSWGGSGLLLVLWLSQLVASRA